MAMHQTRHYSHNLAPAAGGSSLFFDDYAGCLPAPARIGDATAVLLSGDLGFLPRKRPRVEAAAPAAGGGFLQDQPAGTPPPACTDTWRLLPVPPPFVDARGRGVGSGAASTSGRVLAKNLVSETELRASETELARALRRNAELEEKARQAVAEFQAWMGVARSNEPVAAGLRATLDQLLLQSPSPPCGTDAGCGGEAEAEDAQSCCFEDGGGACTSSRSATKSLACKSCGGGEACVLLLPSRHLCLCRACEATAAVDACPVCSATKNGSLHVLFGHLP